jgi:hypothetical protein
MLWEPSASCTSACTDDAGNPPPAPRWGGFSTHTRGWAYRFEGPAFCTPARSFCTWPLTEPIWTT